MNDQDPARRRGRLYPPARLREPRQQDYPVRTKFSSRQGFILREVVCRGGRRTTCSRASWTGSIPHLARRAFGDHKILDRIAGIAGLLGTVFDNQAIRAGAFVTVIAFVLSVMLLLMADRRRLKRAYELQRAQLAQYCDYVVEKTPDPHISIESWRQVVYLRPNGDAREVLHLKAVALREQVHFVRLTSGSRWDQPEKYRRDVQVTARSITADGTPGPHWNVTTAWQSTRKMISIPHLRQAINRGEEVTFDMVRTWPAKCLPMMREKEAEDFTLRTTERLQVRRIEYRVVLPPGFDAVHELIGSTHPDVRLWADTEYDQENRRVFVWHSEDVPAFTTVGIRLELK